MRAPRLSAAYSRVRLIGIWTIMAASGARMSMSTEPTTPRLLLLSRLPPKNMRSCASIEMAPAMLWLLSCQRVVITDMAQFVTDDAGDFVAAK
jgi:hypothetical protein